jgi:hypothetical protein
VWSDVENCDAKFDRCIGRWIDGEDETDRAQWRRLKEFAEARLVGGERRHFDIPSSQRKVTVRSEVSFDDDKKKEKYTFERTSGTQGEQWIGKGGGSGGAEVHVFTVGIKASELADILCGATLKITTQSSIDGSMEKMKRTVHSDDVWRSLRKRDLWAVNGVILTFRQVSARWRSGPRSRSTTRKKKKYTFERTSGAQGEQWILKGGGSGGGEVHVSTVGKMASELADILCGATLKITTQSSIDGSMDREKMKRTVHSDDVWRSLRKRDLWAVNGVILTFRQVSARWRSGPRSRSTTRKKKKIHVRTDVGGAGWAVNWEGRWKRWRGSACFHRWKDGQWARRHFVWSDVENYDAKFDRWIGRWIDGEDETDRAQWRRLKEFAEARLVGGERRHFDIPSSQRKVTVRSEVSFDDEKKKENTRSNGRRGAGWAVNFEGRWKRWRGSACFHRWKDGQWARRHFVWSDVENYDAKFDRWIGRWIDGEDETDRAQWRRLKEFAEARLVGGERRHFDIPSSQRKVTVRSEVSFDDDKKKEKYTFERTSGAQGEQWILKGGGSGGAEVHVSTVGKWPVSSPTFCVERRWKLRRKVRSIGRWIDGEDETDRAQWRRLKEFAEARLVGGERRHFDIPSSQRKVTVRSEVSFDDDKKKEKYTFERTSGAQGEQWILKGGGSGGAEVHVSTVG